MCYAMKRESKAIPDLKRSTMGDSYREALKKNKARIQASESISGSTAATRAALRKEYLRKSPAGRRAAAKAAQLRLF